MKIDENKIDEAALALLFLTLHDEYGSAWKQLDWGVTQRLHAKGLIENPVNKSKSLVLTAAGKAKSEQLFHQLFSLSE
ncbi:DUF6429 family protein [Shewanella sp. C32]|uniref:DUF6429 family protein n=1 Tax=Shewanella electrica TaxID=515560 RepID=A0ABT2FII7_9GAMM|nr:DUF6429 family protein [Shewanella electrica]MCH1924242.1 DUF6429 family protein [Shewanella electrica]MCS4556145.1 DUF6429 family protein [Shewanella electrica]